MIVGAPLSAPRRERERGTSEKFADELSGSRHFNVALYPMEGHAEHRHWHHGTEGSDERLGMAAGATPDTMPEATECLIRQMHPVSVAQGAVGWVAYQGWPI